MSPLFSGESYIDRETILDILVNVVPMVILLAFVLLFVVFSPWPPHLPTALVGHFLTLFPFLLLGILTYFAARAISRDEKGGEPGGE